MILCYNVLWVTPKYTQLRVATNSRHAFLFLYQEHSLTLDMCKDNCTVAGLWYSTLPGLWFLSPLHQSLRQRLRPLHHFSLNARKWAVLRRLNDWFLTLQWDTYLSFSPLHHLQYQWWFGIQFIKPHIPGGIRIHVICISYMLFWLGQHTNIS